MKTGYIEYDTVTEFETEIDAGGRKENDYGIQRICCS